MLNLTVTIATRRDLSLGVSVDTAIESYLTALKADNYVYSASCDSPEGANGDVLLHIEYLPKND